MARRKKVGTYKLVNLEEDTSYDFSPREDLVMVKLTRDKRVTTHSLSLDEGRFLYKHLRGRGFVKQ